MSSDMDGKRARRIWWDGEESPNTSATEKVTLVFRNIYHGDHDEDWIIQLEDGVETCRHNCKYISTIEWEKP